MGLFRCCKSKRHLDAVLSKRHKKLFLFDDKVLQNVFTTFLKDLSFLKFKKEIENGIGTDQRLFKFEEFFYINVFV